MQLDAVIIGGGAAGLWLLDELVRQRRSVLLLEASNLGRGQTVASQGIIHGGLKYTLQGLLTPSAAQIREMPQLWRDCLAGRRAPDLSQTRIRSESCLLWRTDSMKSRLGMLGARVGLRVAPQTVGADECPSLLAGCLGSVARLAEQVIAPASFVADLARQHRQRILKVDRGAGVSFQTQAPGHVESIQLIQPQCPRRGNEDRVVTLQPRHVVFAAGAGNSGLRAQVGLQQPLMQHRPLHMVLLRGCSCGEDISHGGLPQFNGHCVDGAKTRVTITSDADSAGRTVWQVGGQLAEDGVRMDEAALVRHARAELEAVLPGADFSRVEWSTYRVDRAERTTPNGQRPETAQIILEGNCVTAWPTKLALVPQLADAVVKHLVPASGDRRTNLTAEWAAAEFADWPRPTVAMPPWEAASHWYHSAEIDFARSREAA